jgi:hypothetical protein
VGHSAARHAARRSAVALPLALLLAAAPSAVAAGGDAAAAAAGADALSVAELDLAGVSAAALPALPQRAPVPAEDAAAADGPASVQAPGPADAALRTAPDVLTEPMDTEPFTVLGVTWDADPDVTDVVVRYRVREDGTWSDWAATGASDIAPDADGREAAGPGTRGAIDPVVARDADGLQLWVDAATGTVSGVKAVLVDPGSDPVPAGGGAGPAGAGAPAGGVTAAAVVVPGPPAIISRAGWGADESMRTCDPEYSSRMVSAAVHHTASANGYAAGDVPGILRGILAFHTRPEAAGGRGWCDIGYNFLVDRFGRVFEGRAGGVDRTVVGVHTGGFNSRTIGVAAIGDFGATGVPAATTDAIVALLSWKFAMHNIDANARVTMVSGGGASKYPQGTVVSFPTVYGHRDAQQTSCPGENLYAQLPAIRSRVAARSGPAGLVSPRGNWETTGASPTGFTVTGWALDPQVAAPVTIRVEIDGAVVTARADVPRPDIERVYPALGPRHGFHITVPRGAGSPVVCLWAVNVGDGRDVSLGCQRITVRNAAPVGALDVVRAGPSGVTVSGWTLDPDTSAPNDAHVYIDGVGASVVADQPRPDVAAVYGLGERHGFTHTRTLPRGQHTVCLFSIDTSGGTNTLVACRDVTVGAPAPRTPPIGVVESVVASNTAVSVGGWALDPDTTDPVSVHVYVDRTGVARLADLPRRDVAAVHGRGDRHGFQVSVPAKPGRHEVCVYAINTGPGGNTLVACRAVVVPDRVPIGAVEAVTVRGDRLETSGWALDPDTTASTDVHVYVDGVGHRVRADLPRPDVAAAHGLGDRHGFTHSVPAVRGRHTVCVYGINTSAGPPALLACRAVQVP